MVRISKVSLTTLLFTIGLFAATGCSSAGAPSAPVETPAAAPAATAARPVPAQWTPPRDPNAKPGGVLIVQQSGDPPNLDPHLNQGSLYNTWAVASYERLLQYGWGPGIGSNDRVLVPGLAERWEQTDDKTYIFHLRKGVKFQNVPPVNGREVTAEDVLYSFQRLKGSAFGFPLEDVDTMAATDASTFKVTLKQPSVSFIQVGPASDYPCACIVPKEAVEAGGGDLKNGPTIGTGPFLFGEWKRGQGLTFKKNPDYWDTGLPYLDGYELRVIPDVPTAIAAWRTGQIDMSAAWGAVDKATRESAAKSNPDAAWVKVETINPGSVMGFKLDQPPFNDVNVRRAISKAINRQDIIDTVYLGEGHLNFSHVQVSSSKDLLPADKLKSYYQNDLAEAKRLMAASAHPGGFDMELVVGNGYGQDRFTAAELIVGWLKEIGIRVKIKSVERTAYAGDVLLQAKYQHSYYGPLTAFTEPDVQLKAMFYSKGVRNVQGIKDAELDALIEQQGATFDPEKRRVLLQSIQQRLLDNVYGMGIYALQSYEGIQPWVKNFHLSPARPTDRVVRTLWIDQTKKKR